MQGVNPAHIRQCRGQRGLVDDARALPGFTCDVDHERAASLVKGQIAAVSEIAESASERLDRIELHSVWFIRDRR